MEPGTPRRRKTDHWRSFLQREAFLVVLVFVVLGVLAAGLVVLRAEFEEHNKRSEAADLCLLDAAGTPIPNKTIPEVKAERRRLYGACVRQEAPGVESPLKKEKSP